MRVALYYYRKWFTDPRIYIAFFLGSLFIINHASNYILYARSINEPINFLEPFIYAMNTLECQVIVFASFILLISDAPFIDNNSVYILLRSKKEKWSTGIILYLLGSALLYLFVLTIVTILFGIFHAYVVNAWSDPIYTLAVYSPRNAHIEYEIAFPYIGFLQAYTPITAYFSTMFLQLGYYFFFALLIFLFNFQFKYHIGSIIGIIFHAISYVIILDAGYIDIKYSLISYCIPIFHNGQTITLLKSGGLFLCLILLLYLITLKIIRRSSYELFVK